MTAKVEQGSVFQRYSAYYDLLYRDKDYAAEAAYVAERIREFVPSARTILELGSGTGRHGRLLAGMGFDVHGIERSAEMVSVARSREAAEGNGSFTCEVGDICTARLGRTFDAVISLFHVISYQTTDEALAAAFDVARRHLNPGGVFLFDVWHGPAVLRHEPVERIKEVVDATRRVRRTARPEHVRDRKVVNVVYDVECEDFGAGESVCFTEQHAMRYLFPDEIRRLGAVCGFSVVHSEEFFTRAQPSADSWGVAYVVRA